MAPQGSIPPIANILGTIGTVLWCVQLIPQAVHNWRKKTTEGLPSSMMLMWALSSVPFGTYAIVQRFAVPLQIQAQIFCFFALVNWGQTKYYSEQWSLRKTALATGGYMFLCGGLELLFSLTLRIPYDKGIEAPMLVMGIISCIMLGAGLIPPYFELWKRNGRVVGINWMFLLIDWSGALISLLAVVYQNTFDLLGGIEYCVVLGLETGIFLSHAIWRIRTWKLHKKAKEQGIKFDELPEAREYQHHPKNKKKGHASETTEDLEKGAGGEETCSHGLVEPQVAKDVL